MPFGQSVAEEQTQSGAEDNQGKGEQYNGNGTHVFDLVPYLDQRLV
jgi:hypothetical protein